VTREQSRAWQDEVRKRTEATATRAGQPWEAWEDQRVLSARWGTLADVAVSIGRSHRAVTERRHRLNKR
jgi:hypothetical protein